MKKLLVCLAVLAAAQTTLAQSATRYIIQFRNKVGTPYSAASPQQFLSQRAIDRRTRYGIAVDSMDFPLNPRYLDSVRLAGAVTLLPASRWLNQVAIQTTDAAALARINAFPFVQSVAPIGSRLAGGSGGSAHGTKALNAANFSSTKTQKSKQQKRKPFGVARTAADFFAYGLSYDQVHMHNGEFLHNIGLRGQGMVIGMLDAGFFNYTTLRAFDSVNSNGQVLGTYDFVARETSVVEDDSHGMHCFSIIAANIPGQFVGTAPKASFYLFRSEEAAAENPIEEHFWVCAAERLDSAGGDVISSSVGYNTFDNPAYNHTFAQLDGNTTIAARGADLAAKKGVLVVNSVGNEGANSWGRIITPADGDSVLAVGAVTRDSLPAGFTSQGPSADGQVKPDVASRGVGTVLQGANNTIGASNGTSYSAPNMAGLATCLWQGFPEANNQRILVALRQAGHKAASPDTRVGYGIPDMKKAVLALLKEFSTASVATSGNCRYTIGWTSKDIAGMRYEIDRKGAGETGYRKIGERLATGTTFSARSHQFVDSVLNIAPGTVSYRIRQIVDTAATGFAADYIDTVSTTYNMACDVTSLPPVGSTDLAVVLLPNPATNNLTVKITTPNAVTALTFRLVNAAGQVVKTERRAKAAGTVAFPLSLNGLATGKYFVSVYDGQKHLATKELLKL